MYIKLLVCSAGRLEVVGYLVNIESLFDVEIVLYTWLNA